MEKEEKKEKGKQRTDEALRKNRSAMTARYESGDGEGEGHLTLALDGWGAST